MANYPQALAQDAVCQSYTGHMTEHWFLPTRPLRLNTNEYIYIYIYIYIYMLNYIHYITEDLLSKNWITIFQLIFLNTKNRVKVCRRC